MTVPGEVGQRWGFWDDRRYICMRILYFSKDGKTAYGESDSGEEYSLCSFENAELISERCVFCGEDRNPWEFEDGLLCVYCQEA